MPFGFGSAVAGVFASKSQAKSFKKMVKIMEEVKDRSFETQDKALARSDELFDLGLDSFQDTEDFGQSFLEPARDKLLSLLSDSGGLSQAEEISLEDSLGILQGSLSETGNARSGAGLLLRAELGKRAIADSVERQASLASLVGNVGLGVLQTNPGTDLLNLSSNFFQLGNQALGTSLQAAQGQASAVGRVGAAKGQSILSVGRAADELAGAGAIFATGGLSGLAEAGGN